MSERTGEVQAGGATPESEGGPQVGAASAAEAVEPPAPASLWRNRDYQILWTGETVSQLGSAMSYFVFPIVGYSITGSTAAAALSLSAFTAGNVASKLPAGVLVDRWNRRAIMLASNVAGVVLYGGLALALTVGQLTLAHLVTVALLTGIAGSFYGPAETAALRRVVPAQQLPTAFSQNQARRHIASLVGPPLGGGLFSVARAIPFLVDAVTFAAAAVATTLIKTPLPAPERSITGTRMRAEIAEGLRYLWSEGFLRAIVLFACLANFAGNALFLVVTLKLLRAGVHPAAIGSIDAIAAVAGIVGAILAPAMIKRVPTGLLSIAAGLAFAAMLAPMAFTNSVLVIGALLAVATFFLPAGNASVSSYFVATTPDHLQGRAQSALGFAASGLMPLGGVVGGALLGWLGGKAAMLVIAGLTALSVLPLLLSRDVRELPTPDKWDIKQV